MSGRREVRSVKYILVLLLTAVLSACGRMSPQRPSQRLGQTPEPDSSHLALIELNHRLAETADQEVLRWVQSQSESYALYELHAWLTFLERGDRDVPALQPDDRVEVHMQVYDLHGKMLMDSQRQYTIGKMELPPAVDANICALHPHARVRIAVPWYTAFGAQGNDDIPPYTNVIIDLAIQ